MTYKKLFENTTTIILGTILIFCFLYLTGCSQQTEEPKSGKLVFEKFVITSVEKNGDVIHGELVKGKGEGIYLDPSYYKWFEQIKGQLKVGDKIRVAYDKKDYVNEVWDNIIDIKEIK